MARSTCHSVRFSEYASGTGINSGARSGNRAARATQELKEYSCGMQARRKRRSADQRHLDLFGQKSVSTQPQSSIICDAPVAPTSLRMEAGMIDGLLMAVGRGFGLAIFRYFDGQISLEKHSLFFLALALDYSSAFLQASMDVCGHGYDRHA